MALELESLRRTVEALERSLNAASTVREADPALQETVRAGVIQHFVMAYEICWKFMKRWIEVNIGASQVDGVTRRELFRQAAENHLIQDVEAWMARHHARNLTSHTYDAPIAEEVFKEVPGLLADAKRFLSAIEARND